MATSNSRRPNTPPAKPEGGDKIGQPEHPAGGKLGQPEHPAGGQLGQPEHPTVVVNINIQLSGGDPLGNKEHPVSLPGPTGASG